MPELGHIVPALVTPYRDDGSVHHPSLVRIVERCLEGGADGFYVCGSTGEAFLLTEEERMAVLETVVKASAGRAAVIAHVGAVATDVSIRLARHAADAGACAISAVPPFYYGFSMQEIQRHYLDIIDAAGMPMIVYNFPANTGVTLDVTTAPELLAHPSVVAVKHTSVDLYQLERMKRAREDLVLFNGHDEVFLGGLSMGADGAIGSTFNVLAEHFVMIRQLFLSGDLTDAARLQRRVNDLISTLIAIGVFNGIKYLLEQEGIPSGSCRRPFQPLTAANKARLNKAWARLEAPTSLNVQNKP